MEQNYIISAKRKREITGMASSRRGLPLASALAFCVAGLGVTSHSFADSILPQGASVPSGNATLHYSDHHLNVDTTGNSIINWAGGFNIGAADSVNYHMPSASNISLNRDISGHLSEIQGQLTSNGHVWLVNNNGVFIGKNAQINVAGLLATTANISDANFNAGHYLFDQPGRPDASIINEGNITAADGGLIALLAPGMRNDGIIAANLGTVVLGSGQTFALDFYGDHLYSFSVNTPADRHASDNNGKTLDAAITNTGTITAKGGTVYMTARAAKEVVDQAINTTGIVEASSAHSDGGEIILDGGEGAVNVSGTLDAAGQKGGTIQITSAGNDIHLASATLNASGKNGGGRVAIGGGARGKGPLAHARRVTMDKTSIINASSTRNKAGNVTLWSDESTRFYGTIDISSKHGTGGNAEVSSAETLTYGGFTNASGAKGLGQLLLDPGNWTISSAADDANNQNVTTLATQLGSADVTIDTATAGTAGAHAADLGDISVLNALSWSGPGSLTLNAAHDITIADNVQSTFAGTSAQGALSLNAGHSLLVGSPSTTVSVQTAKGDISATTGADIQLTHGATLTSGHDLNLNNSGIFSTTTTGVLNAGNNLNLRQNAGGSLQNAINAEGSVGGTYALTAGNGTYMENLTISRPLSLRSLNGRNLTTIQGISGAGADAAITLANAANNVTIGDTGHGFTIEGFDNGNQSVSNAAVKLVGSHDDVTLRGNNMVANGDWALVTVYLQPNSNMVVDNNIFSGQTYLGAAPSPIGNVSRQLVELYNGMSNLTFTNNTINGNAGAAALVATQSAGALVSNNIFAGTTGSYALFSSGSNYTITGNTLTGHGNEFGIALNNATGHNIIGDGTVAGANTLNNFYTAISVDNATADVTSNTITGLRGIRIANNSHQVNVTHNTISANQGFIIDHSAGILIADNTMNNVSHFGISSNYGDTLTITGNTITSSTSADTGILFNHTTHSIIGGNNPGDGNDINGFSKGIELNISSDNNQVISNQIGAMSGTHANGVTISGSSGNQLASNTVTGNGTSTGVQITGSNNSTLTGNNISNNNVGISLNTTQATTISSDNLSNNGIGLSASNGTAGTVVSSTAFTDNTLAVALNDAGSSMSFGDSLNTFTGTGGYFTLTNGAMAGQTLEASQQTFNGTQAALFTDAQFADAESRTIDSHIDPTLGFVHYRDAANTTGGGSTGGIITSPSTALLDQLVQRPYNPIIQSLFSYAGQTINSSPTLLAYHFRVQELNLSLLGSVANTGNLPAQLGSLSPSAGGGNTAGDFANLSPAAGGGTGGLETCGNGFLATGATPNSGSCGLLNQ